MRHVALVSIVIILAFLTTGCGKPAVSPTSTTTPKVVIKKQPTVKETKNPAFDFCQNSGYEVVIRFDQKTQTSKAFCQFKDGSECGIEEYLAKKCAPGKGATGGPNFATSTAKPNDFAVCTNEFVPVCGADGVNYTNACLAQIQGIKIAHKGVCTQKESAQIQEESYSIDEQTQPGITSITQETPNTWLPVVKDMILSSSPSDPPAFIEKCVISGSTYYYRSDGCSECESFLYDTGGEIICYPSNDIDGSCPINFTKANRAKYCERIWQDPR